MKSYDIYAVYGEIAESACGPSWWAKSSIGIEFPDSVSFSASRANARQNSMGTVTITDDSRRHLISKRLLGDWILERATKR
ncbi:MAG: hypothetical protein FWH17_10570 [Oscillospiraceae bacterium]|nr:hypothetical protein [Oscillospiraceae bacterium]